MMVGKVTQIRSLLGSIKSNSKHHKKHDQARPGGSLQDASVDKSSDDTGNNLEYSFIKKIPNCNDYYTFLEYKYKLELLHSHVEQAQLFINRKIDTQKENDENFAEDEDYLDLLEYKYQLELLITQVEQAQLVVERKIDAQKDNDVELPLD